MTGSASPFRERLVASQGPARWYVLAASLLQRGGIVLALLTLMGVFSALAPGFLSAFNLLSIVVQSATNAVVALGMTFVIISAGIDLSVGSVVALVAVVAATLMRDGTIVSGAVVASLALGAFCGVINGLLVARLRLQPFIATLGTMSLYRGVALVYTDGYPILHVPPTFKLVFAGAVGPVGMPVIIVAILSFAAWFILRHTAYGEHVQALGGNEEAARLAGVRVDRVKILTYALSGLTAALAALILVARLGAAEPIQGQGWELDAIAASAVGGASLSGGKGSILGTVIGALILGVLRNGLTLLNVQSFYQMLATGMIILVAVLIDTMTQSRR